jgi:hypothetical protein
VTVEVRGLDSTKADASKGWIREIESESLLNERQIPAQDAHAMVCDLWKAMVAGSWCNGVKRSRSTVKRCP